MIRWPRTSFGRAALATGTVMVLGQVLALMLIRGFLVEPGARLMGRLIAHEMLLSARLKDAEGTSDDLLVSRHAPKAVVGSRLRYMRVLLETVKARLGEGVEVRLQGGASQVVWARMDTSGGVRWLGVRLDPTPGRIDLVVFLWFLGISLLSLLVALWVVRQLDRPLRRLATAARCYGAGETTSPLIAEGPVEVRTLIKTFNRMIEDRQRREEEQRVLLAGISHDLRTPLTRLRLCLEMLPASEAELVAGGKQDVEEMDAVLSQFIAFAQGVGEEPVEPVDLAVLVRELAEEYRPRLPGLKLDLVRPPLLPLRPRAVRRLLGNLVENAAGHGGGDIVIRLRKIPGGVRLWVLDRGPGIPAKEREYVLQPYARLRRASDKVGSGLGLAIVDTLCRQQGIGLILYDRPGGGLGVLLEFPERSARSRCHIRVLNRSFQGPVQHPDTAMKRRLPCLRP